MGVRATRLTNQVGCTILARAGVRECGAPKWSLKDILILQKIIPLGGC